MALLNSLKILDFSGLLPGPYGTMMLADLGAEILRVEPPNKPDLMRTALPRDGESSAAFDYVNRNKQSIALDLKKPEAVDLVKRLIQKYDIVLEQFRPGVMDRLGLGYEVLKKINPKLIYCSLTGYGQTGPYRDRPGHDNNYLAIAGIAHVLARKEGGPIPLGIQVADVAGGSLHTVIGILAAVIYREKTGQGQHIDISMTDAVFALNAIYGPGYLACGVEAKPEEMPLNGGSFYGYYQTKDGRYFSVGSLEPQFRKILCEAIGKPDCIELAMSNHPANVTAFKELLRTVFLSKMFQEWLDIFTKFQACVEPVLTYAEACEHPHIQARKMVVEVQKPDGSTQKQISCPIKFSAHGPKYIYVDCKVGAETTKVLQELGLSEEKIKDLKTRGVVG